MSKEYDHIRKNTKSLDPIEAILHRPDIDLGSIENHKIEGWIYNSKKEVMEYREYTINHALLKIVDEIISNIADARISNKNITKGDIIITGNTIVVSDNGGIPVEKTETGDYYIERLFGNLNTGTNYNDSEERYTIGKFGKGSKLTNIFSKRFKVSSGDGNKNITVEWTDNMRSKTEPIIKKSSKKGTIIEFEIDFQRFGVSGFNDDIKAHIEQRVLVASATNPEINYSFNNKPIKIKTFKDYLLLYGFDKKNLILFDDNPNFIWGVYPNEDIFESIEQISFVNGAETKKGGTHIDLLLLHISAYIKHWIDEKTKDGDEISYHSIKKLFIPFICAKINQPKFASQSKVLLTSNVDSFKSELLGDDNDTDRFMLFYNNVQKVYKSAAITAKINTLKDIKKQENKLKKQREANSIETDEFRKFFVPCTSNNTSEKILFVSEGDSASKGFQKFRNPKIHAAYKLGGKIMNVSKQEMENVLKSKKIQGLATIIGLKYGKRPKNLNFGKIYINVDADMDGISIAAVLINFFYTYWKDLFDMGMIYLIETPLFVAKKGKKSVIGYTLEEMKKYNGWEIDYFKGLSSLPDSLYEDMIHNPKLIKFNSDKDAEKTLQVWFGENNSDLRKDRINKITDNISDYE